MEGVWFHILKGDSEHALEVILRRFQKCFETLERFIGNDSRILTFAICGLPSHKLYQSSFAIGGPETMESVQRVFKDGGLAGNEWECTYHAAR